VCPIKVLHSYRNYDGNSKFEKNEKSAQNETHLFKMKKEIRSKVNTTQQRHTNVRIHFETKYSELSDW